MKQWEVQWTLYQQRLAGIRVSVSRYKGPSEHDECVRDMKFLLGEIDRLTHMAELKSAQPAAGISNGGNGLNELLAKARATLAAQDAGKEVSSG